VLTATWLLYIIIVQLLSSVENVYRLRITLVFLLCIQFTVPLRHVTFTYNNINPVWFSIANSQWNIILYFINYIRFENSNI